MESRSKVIITILSGLLVVVGIVAVYLGISLSGMEVIVDNLENELASNESKQNSDKIQVKDESVENTSNKVETVEKVVYKYLPNINEGKCLNGKENVNYTVNRYADFNGVSAYINDDGKTVGFNVNGNVIKEKYTDVNITEYKTYSITNFSKKVVKVYIEGMGHGIGNEVLYFIMEDGTVEYMPIYKALKVQEFKSYGKLENVSNIVEIATGMAQASEDGSGNGPSWNTVFAINYEGNYYDIGDIVENKIK